MAEPATKLPVETHAPGGALTRHRGTRPFVPWYQEVDQLFDQMLGRPFFPRRRSLMPEGAELAAAADFSAPAVEVIERDDEYEVVAEVPGLDESEIEVKVANGVLTIAGEKAREQKKHQKDIFMSERRYGYFSRSLTLPSGVDSEKIEAHMAKGLLKVRLPKTPEAKALERRIKVKAD